MPAISVVVFDVNETLSDLAPLARRFADVGASPALARLWFAELLRDGFALTSLGESAPFADLGREGLRLLLRQEKLNDDLEAAVAYVMAGFADLGVHPDVVPGVRALRESGTRLVTLSNGAAAVAERLLTEAGIRKHFEQVLTVEDAGLWKPAARAYQYSAEMCATDLAQMLMVAVHPWDIHGAASAGMRTAWINRNSGAYPTHFHTPDHIVTGLAELADAKIL